MGISYPSKTPQKWTHNIKLTLGNLHNIHEVSVCVCVRLCVYLKATPLDDVGSRVFGQVPQLSEVILVSSCKQKMAGSLHQGTKKLLSEQNLRREGTKASHRKQDQYGHELPPHMGCPFAYG